jgi:hypothetical protein
VQFRSLLDELALVVGVRVGDMLARHEFKDHIRFVAVQANAHALLVPDWSWTRVIALGEIGE